MNFVSMLLQTFIALGLVCGVALLVFRFVLPRLQTLNTGRSMVRVVDRIGLESRRSLYVVHVGGKWLLLAASEAGVQLVSELDSASAEEAAAQLEHARHQRKSLEQFAGNTFAEQLARTFTKLINLHHRH